MLFVLLVFLVWIVGFLLVALIGILCLVLFYWFGTDSLVFGVCGLFYAFKFVLVGVDLRLFWVGLPWVSRVDVLLGFVVFIAVVLC